MTLPWVSRTAFDLVCDARDHEREVCRELRHSIVEMLGVLRAYSPHYPHVAADIAKYPEPEIIVLPDPIREVIREQADQGGRENHQLASHLRKFARALKREGLSDDAIVAKLTEWQTSETNES